MPTDEQRRLPFPETPREKHSLDVLDLFTGLGGLATGFREAGFSIIGVDNDDVAAKVYEVDHLGTFEKADLSTTMVLRNVSAVIGGPPCRPWSNVNLQRRREKHGDYMLLDRYFEHIKEIRPELFVMENVLALKSDEVYKRRVAELRGSGYSVDARILRYSDFGAATSRRRLFTVGVRNSQSGAHDFFELLNAERTAPGTVRSAIYWAREVESGAFPDHDWSTLETIGKYEERYRTGQYGWKRLEYDKPAPSFGSIAKTYILHPEAGEKGFPLRVLSVREAMSIIGFSREFSFPVPTARAKRYQMVANAVSPLVSRACARAVRQLLDAGGDASSRKVAESSEGVA
jgi:DNA (cytosine-5)-methyltransferase 1